MTLQWISILIGSAAFIGGLAMLLRPDFVKKSIELFPRSIGPAWVLMALCCFLGAKEALGMNMGFLEAYKKYIYVLSPAVFVASVIYLKELLAPRALGGFLLLISVPILQIARWNESSLRLVIVVLVYLWIIYGLTLLMSPWYFRKLSAKVVESPTYFKIGALAKVSLGLVLILLGAFAY